MIIRVSKKKILAVIMGIILVLCSGHALQSIVDPIRQIVLVTAVFFLAPAILSFSRQRLNVYTFSLLVLTAMVGLTMLAHFGSGTMSYVRQICMLITAFGFTAVFPFQKVIKVYLKLMTWVSVIALIGYVLSNYTGILSVLPKVTNVNGRVYHIGIIFNYMPALVQRNCGMFWEPGLFATALAYAIIFEALFQEEKVSTFRVILFSVCILTSNSTAGYVLWILCMLLLFFKARESKNQNALIAFLSPLLLVALILVILNLDAIIISTGLADNPYVSRLLSDNLSQSSRAFAIAHNLAIFLENPLWGAGVVEVAERILRYADTSTSTHLMSEYGILGLSYTIFWIVGVWRQKKLNLFCRILLTAIVLFIINKEPHSAIMFSWCLMFYLLMDTEPRKPREFTGVWKVRTKIKLSSKMRALEQEDRSLLGNIALAFLVKGASLVLSMFSMPLYIRYFGNNAVLGAWYTALSILSWISMCDLGLGNGLRNKLTEVLASGDDRQARKYVSSTYCLLAVIILPVALLGNVLIRFVDLNGFLKLDPTVVSNEALQNCLAILFTSICISFVLKTINMVIYALQRSSLNNVLALVTSAIPLLFMALFRQGDMERNLYTLSLVHGAAINLPLLAASLAMYRRSAYGYLRPTLRSVDILVAKKTIGLGLRFFLAQVAFMLLTTTNELLITRFFSSADVVEYSVYYKLYTAVGSLFMLALTPMWSQVTRNLARKRYDKVRKTNYLLYGISAVAAAAQFAMVLCLQWLVNLWLGAEAIRIHYPTACIFALFGSLFIFNVVLTTIANGMGALGTQIVFYGVGAALKFPVLGLLTGWIPHWQMVVAYNCVVFGAFCLYQLFWVEKKLKSLNE